MTFRFQKKKKKLEKILDQNSSFVLFSPVSVWKPTHLHFNNINKLGALINGNEHSTMERRQINMKGQGTDNICFL